MKQLSNELQLGKAGEHLVCADLILKGYTTYLSDQGIPYDVVLDYEHKLYRVQVKSTQKFIDIRGCSCYNFSCAYTGKNGKQYAYVSDFDIMALVALDTKQVAYIISTDCQSLTKNRIKAQIRLFVNRPPNKLQNRCRSKYWDEPRFIDKCPISKVIKDIQ